MPLAAVSAVSLAAIVLAVGDWLPDFASIVPQASDVGPTVPVEPSMTAEASVGAAPDGPPPVVREAALTDVGGRPVATKTPPVTFLDGASPPVVTPPVTEPRDSAVAIVESTAPSGERPAVGGPSAVASAARSPEPDPAVAEALVRENRALAAEVDALREETVELQREMLELDLQIAVLESAELADEPDPGGEGAAPPIELGNTTLVPPPLSASARGGTSADDFAREASGGAFAEDPSELDRFLPQTSLSDVPPSELRFDDLLGGVEMGDAPSPDPTLSLVGVPVERVAIAMVPPGSVAENAGFHPGDVLLGIDGLQIIGFDDVYVHDSDDPAPLHDVEVLRGGERLRVTLAASPLELPLQVTWVDPSLLAQ